MPGFYSSIMASDELDKLIADIVRASIQYYIAYFDALASAGEYMAEHLRRVFDL